MQACLEGGASHTQTVTEDYVSTLVSTPATFKLFAEDGTEAASYKAIIASDSMWGEHRHARFRNDICCWCLSCASESQGRV